MRQDGKQLNLPEWKTKWRAAICDKRSLPCMAFSKRPPLQALLSELEWLNASEPIAVQLDYCPEDQQSIGRRSVPTVRSNQEAM